MRTIKFRVWNYGIAQMYKVYGFNKRQIQWENEDGSLGGAFSYGKNNKKRFALMQFTGLNDKNGKEIYEGDIVKNIHTKDIQKVSYGLFCDDSNSDYSLAKSIGVCVAEDCGLGYDIHGKMEYTVIGNIYENPELLK